MKIGQIMGLILMVVLLGVMSTFGSSLLYFIDIPSLVLLLGFLFATFLLKNGDLKSLTSFLKHCDQLAIPVGALISIFGIISSLIISDSIIPGHFAVALLALFYGVLVKLFVTIR